MIAVMACVMVNGTFKILNPWTKAIPPDPPDPDVVMRLAQLERVVQDQAETVREGQADQNVLVEMLGHLAEVVENRRN